MARVQDVSTGGLFLRCRTVLEPGDRCEVEIDLGDSGIRLVMRVARKTDEGIGLETLRADSESAIGLLHLVKQHLDDPSVVHGELVSSLRTARERRVD